MVKKISSKSIQIRLVNTDDAEFILSLRKDSRYNLHLSNVNDDVESQKEWIRQYKDDEEQGTQFYFIIERLDGTKCGTVRLYDFNDESFSWGSWILNENKTRYAALESAFLVYQYAFGELGFRKSHFEVRKGNEKVIAFHEKMGAIKKSEDELNYYFDIYPDTIWALKERLKGKV